MQITYKNNFIIEFKIGRCNKKVHARILFFFPVDLVENSTSHPRNDTL